MRTSENPPSTTLVNKGKKKRKAEALGAPAWTKSAFSTAAGSVAGFTAA
jgi:hypothetical protein